MPSFREHDADEKLVRMASEPRRPGRLKGRLQIGPDFEEPLPDEILDVFRGESAVVADRSTFASAAGIVREGCAGGAARGRRCGKQGREEKPSNR